MRARANKTQKSKHQSVPSTNSQTQNGGETPVQFADKRPETIAHQKLQGAMNNSQKVSQLKAFLDMANDIPQEKQSTQLKRNPASQKSTPIQLHTGVVQRQKVILDELEVMHIKSMRDELLEWWKKYQPVWANHLGIKQKIRSLGQLMDQTLKAGECESRIKLIGLTFSFAHIELDIEESTMDQELEEYTRRRAAIAQQVRRMSDEIIWADGRFEMYGKKHERSGCVKHGPDIIIPRALASDVYNHWLAKEGKPFGKIGQIHVVKKNTWRNYNITIHRKYRKANPKTQVNLHVSASDR